MEFGYGASRPKIGPRGRTNRSSREVEKRVAPQPDWIEPQFCKRVGKAPSAPRGGVKLSWINIGWRLDATEATFRTSPDPGWIGRANIKKRPPRSQNFPSPIPVSMDKSAEPTPVL
jgi:hypothetical protein